MELTYETNPQQVTIGEGATKEYLMGWLVLDERAETKSWPVRYFQQYQLTMTC
jgi:hypothetical protein